MYLLNSRLSSSPNRRKSLLSILTGRSRTPIPKFFHSRSFLSSKRLSLSQSAHLNPPSLIPHSHHPPPPPQPNPIPIVMRPWGLKVMGWQWRPGLRFNRPWLGELDPVEETGTGPKRIPIGPLTRDVALSLVKSPFQKSRDWPNNSYHVLRHAIRRSFV